jgi:DNA-binding LacI/PurR family transcriptional regulator
MLYNIDANVRPNVRIKRKMPPKVTLKQVAARAGVSYQTISKVLNGQVQVSPDTQARILQAVEELGYRPNRFAQNMRAGRSFMIGYSWVPTSPDQPNHILDQFLSSMVQEAVQAGYHLLPFPYRDGDEHVEDYRELIETGHVDGFVLSSVNFDDPRIAFLLKRGFPFVAFGRSNPDWDFPYVDVDGTEGTRQEVEYLISKGHQHIAVLAWPEESRVGNDRVKGYFAAMEYAGLSVNPNWIHRGEGTFEFGRTAALELLQLPADQRPTAIVALNDAQAIGAIHAAQAQGFRVGEDLAIAGFDDAPMAQYLLPPLTSVRQPIRAAGRACVELLINLIQGNEPPSRQILLKPELILRASA